MRFTADPELSGFQVESDACILEAVGLRVGARRSRQGRGVLPTPSGRSAGDAPGGRPNEPTTASGAASLGMDLPAHQARLPRQTGPRPIGSRSARHGIRLVDVVNRACLPYRDLPIEFALDLAGSVFVDEATARAVGSAVSELLTNVRQHAAARMIVVHADALVADLEWEVTVCDDGRGFHTEVTPRGFGLAVRVEHALAINGISTMITSAPGDGTTVILRGPLPGVRSPDTAERRVAPEGRPAIRPR